MSTHSGISVKVSENEIMHVYNHCDGDLWGAGKTLSDHFNSLERAKALVEQGNISLLRPNVNPDLSKPHGWYDLDYNGAQPNVCRFYDRDRGEEGEKAIVLEDVGEAPDYEFNYYYDGEKWMVREENQKEWEVLTTALEEEGVNK